MRWTHALAVGALAIALAPLAPAGELGWIDGLTGTTGHRDAGIRQDAKPADGKSDEAKGAEWGDNFDKAIARAKKEKKLVLANFTGSDWCPWCKKLHHEVFDTKEFQEWAAKSVVLLELDFPRRKAQSEEVKAQNQKLQEKYKIEGYPTVLFLDASGEKVGEMGYEEGGPASWVKKAQEIIDGQSKK